MPEDSQRAGFRYLGMGVEFVGAVVGLLLAGYWVDRHFGTGPWGLLTGLLVGLAGGLYNMIRGLLAASRGDRDEGEGLDRERPPASPRRGKS